MDWTDFIRVGIMGLSALGIIFALLFTWKMIRFSREYSKQWANSWVMFFIALWIILLRRGIGIVWGTGIDGDFLKILSWVDYIGVATSCTILYVAFLYLNWKWWNKFWTEIKDRDEVIVSNIDIEAPYKVEIVGPDNKKITIESPRKVTVERPKKFQLVTNKKIKTIVKRR